MKVIVRPIGYTQLARHTWEFAVVSDDWLPPMPYLTVGRARTKNDALTLGRCKLAGFQEEFEKAGWLVAPEKAE